MRFPADTPNTHATYAVQTRRRMTHAVCELQAMLRYETGDIDAVMHQMRQQEEAALRRGFERVSTLCRAMKDGVTEVRGAGRPWRSAAAASLLDACRAIQLHADSVAQGVLRIDPRHVRPGMKTRFAP